MQPASDCVDYPVTNYSLEVTELRAEEDSSGMIFTFLENFIKAENLSEDAIYMCSGFLPLTQWGLFPPTSVRKFVSFY